MKISAKWGAYKYDSNFFEHEFPFHLLDNEPKSPYLRSLRIPISRRTQSYDRVLMLSFIVGTIGTPAWKISPR